MFQSGEKRMAYSGPVADRLSIRELIETYNDAVFRRDAEDWNNTWAEDAEWHIFGQVIKGRPDIVSMWKMAMQTFPYVGFFALPGRINVSGNTATATVYVRETIVQDGRVRAVEGKYSDDLIKQGNTWRFKCRRYEIVFDSDNQAE